MSLFIDYGRPFPVFFACLKLSRHCLFVRDVEFSEWWGVMRIALSLSLSLSLSLNLSLSR